MHSLTRRIAATAGAAGMAFWAAGGTALQAEAAPGHATGSTTNPYSPAYGHSYRHGVVPSRGQQQKMQKYAAGAATSPKTLSFAGGIDGIGVTSGTPKIYLVFWGSQWGTETTASNGNYTFSHDPNGGAPYIQNLFKGLGTGGELWSGTMTQYCDGSAVAYGATSCPSGAPLVGYPTGGAFAGVWYDNSAPTPVPSSGHQLATEAVAAAAHFGNTTAASNRYAQYDILSPTGANPDSYKTAGFCAWHDFNGDTTLDGGGAAPSSYGDIAFTNMPYVMDMGYSCGAGFVNAGNILDGYSIVNGHEYAETVTDQNPAGGWTNFTSGQENGDECAWISSGTGAAADVATGAGSFAMQSTWSNDTNSCAISHPIVGGGTTTNDFSMAASPSGGTVTAGQSATTTVSTAVTSGSAQTVALTASGLPSGANAAFNPSSVTAGSSSALTITTSTSTPAGTYSITITGTGASATHTTSYSLTVNPVPGPNAIVNGGFESGAFTPWTTTNVAQVVGSPVHSGVWAGQAGAPTITTGTSTIAQTFTAASGDTKLTFWYDVVCSGSTRTNYATVTLTDNTSARTTTPLGRTCGNSGWRQVTVTITAGHSYTLTLSSHDGSSTKLAYATFDDVSTS
ncbi:MAG TPA: hypothetical protein VFH70_03990 [Acidimicrobiales bacterium]|nr:hypothetical protein [Acidimicrobiales bacterium]